MVLEKAWLYKFGKACQPLVGGFCGGLHCFGKDMEPPQGPKNKKGRPFGSGTTNQKRRDLRAGKQWSAMEQADPSSPEHLLDHLKALEKAQKRCQEKLTEAIQASLDGVVLEEGAGSSSSTSRPNKMAKGGHMQVGKDGQPRKVILTPRDLEKSTTKQDLEKSNSKKDLEKSNSKKDLEKSSSCKDLKKSSSKKDLKKSSSKSKLLKVKGLEKLEVDHAEGLEEPLAEGLEKPLVIVDWHWTLVQDDQSVSDRDIHALKLLLTKADVLILSYVGSEKMARFVEQQVKDLIPFHHLLVAVEVCYDKTGQAGKAQFAWDNLAEAVFDDNRRICQECDRWGIKNYPINSPHQDHRWCGGGFKCFADAVDQYFVDHT